jgi:hypothetical protein
MASLYNHSIRLAAAALGHVGQYDPRHIEAYMRIEHSTLDGLSPVQFAKEVEIGMACVDSDGTDNAERLARSFGL